MTPNRRRPIRLVIFDKDGTLLDYAATWDRAVDDVLAWATNSERYPERWRQAAEAVGFDLDTRKARPESPLIAETGQLVASLFYPYCDSTRVTDPAELAALFAGKGSEYATPVPGADHLLEVLTRHGISAAIATNDDEGPTVATVDALGWSDAIGWVVGADSGFGAKPDPGMVRAVLAHFGVDADEAIMVGDTGHDVAAARGAKVRSVLVAPDGVDASGADVVIRDLSEVEALVSSA